MTRPDYKQTQMELFPRNRESDQEPKTSGMRLNHLTLTTENIIVLSIICVLMLVVFFSFGVERGKMMVRDPQPEPLQQVQPKATRSADSQPDAVTATEKVQMVVEEPVDFDFGGDDDIEVQEIISVPLEKEIEDIDYYTIQVASFKREINARKEAEKLEKKGHETFVLSKGDYSIVCVGKFPAKQDAQSFSSKLKKKYQDLLVRRM